jgi:hypothetical protein
LSIHSFTADVLLVERVAADDVEVQPGRELVGDGARQCLVIERYDRAVDGDTAPLDRDAWLPVTRRSEHDD